MKENSKSTSRIAEGLKRLTISNTIFLFLFSYLSLMIVRDIESSFPFFVSFSQENNLFSSCEIIILFTGGILLRHLFVNRSREIECDRVVYCVTNDTKCCVQICAVLNLSPKDIFIVHLIWSHSKQFFSENFEDIFKNVANLMMKFLL